MNKLCCWPFCFPNLFLSKANFYQNRKVLIQDYQFSITCDFWVGRLADEPVSSRVEREETDVKLGQELEQGNEEEVAGKEELELVEMMEGRHLELLERRSSRKDY